MVDFEKKNSYNTDDLKRIVELLRDKENGCPWDIKQTHDSIRTNFIEETYEAVDAIDKRDNKSLCEELGDVLLQVVLHSQISSEENAFSLDDVTTGICEKLIYRHPHIFANVSADTTEEVLKNWDALKNKEKKITTAREDLTAVPNGMPALMRSKKVQKRAASYGYAYDSVESAFADLESELSELKQAMKDNSNIREELGDLIFSVTNVARILKVDAEEALTESTNKFISRVCIAEDEAISQGKTLKELNDDERDVLWKKAKMVKAGE